jgi:hypothetical protein
MAWVLAALAQPQASHNTAIDMAMGRHKEWNTLEDLCQFTTNFAPSSTAAAITGMRSFQILCDIAAVSDDEATATRMTAT